MALQVVLVDLKAAVVDLQVALEDLETVAIFDYQLDKLLVFFSTLSGGLPVIKILFYHNMYVLYVKTTLNW